ncbi:hypothetical protein Hanom_Chr08g00683611 [Helianthus anomalus]
MLEMISLIQLSKMACQPVYNPFYFNMPALLTCLQFDYGSFTTGHVVYRIPTRLPV